AYPWDKSNIKSITINLKNFEKLDNYARKVAKPNTVDQLVNSLLKITRTDLEKVRAFWIWICHNIEYDLESLENKSKWFCDPNQTLLTGKGACEGYAGLFDKMCSLAGIKCFKIGGYSKGFGYTLGQTFSGDSNHAWNAVYLNKRWHLLDTTWGAGFADSNSNTFTFRYNEFYFLTNPALFIEEHFPDNKNWQLLQVPLTLKHFEGNLCRSSSFYNVGLVTSYPETLQVETVNGKATFSIEGHSPALFSFTLNKTEKPGLMTLTKNGMQLDVYPNVTGHHKLELYTKPYNSAKESYEKVVEYILHCGAVDTDFTIPMELNNPVGPNCVSEKKGLIRPSYLEPIICTEDGRCSLSFGLDDRIDIVATLHGDDIMSEDVRRRHVFQIIKDGRVEFQIHLPKAGTYVLKLCSKKKSIQSNIYDYACNYLITCSNPDIRWPFFPMRYNSWDSTYELLEPLNGILPANSIVQFKIKARGLAAVLVKAMDICPLTLNSEGCWEGTCNTKGSQEIQVLLTNNLNKNYALVLSYQIN
ncbi:hypothetical protein GDO86_010347, partial [Hymenochirus boettgeri]